MVRAWCLNVAFTMFFQWLVVDIMHAVNACTNMLYALDNLVPAICSSGDFSALHHWVAGAGMVGELVAALKTTCDEPAFLLQAVATHTLLKLQSNWQQVTEATNLGHMCLIV